MEYIMAKRVTNSPATVGNKGNGGLSLPKNVSWPSWLKGSVASYIGLGLFGSLVVLFLADFAFFHPILMIILLAGVVVLLVQDMKKIRWLKLIVLLILLGSIANYALSLRGDEVPSISEKAVEVAPATQPFLGDDRGSQEHTRGVAPETVTLPPATQLPTTLTFSSSGTIRVGGRFIYNSSVDGEISFDPKNGERTYASGTTSFGKPVRNLGQFLSGDYPWGILLIRQQGSNWVQAEGFNAVQGVEYEIGLNVNHSYRRYITSAPEINLKLYSE